MNQTPPTSNGNETVTQSAEDMQPQRIPRARHVTGHEERFVYGGVAFELLGASPTSLSDVGAQATVCIVRDEATAMRAFARVTCAVREDLPRDPATAGGREATQANYDY